MAAFYTCKTTQPWFLKLLLHKSMAEAHRSTKKDTRNKTYCMFPFIWVSKISKTKSTVRRTTSGGSKWEGRRNLLGGWTVFVSGQWVQCIHMQILLTCIIKIHALYCMQVLTQKRKLLFFFFLNSKVIDPLPGIIGHINNSVPETRTRRKTVLQFLPIRQVSHSFMHRTFTVCPFHDKKLTWLYQVKMQY